MDYTYSKRHRSEASMKDVASSASRNNFDAVFQPKLGTTPSSWLCHVNWIGLGSNKNIVGQAPSREELNLTVKSLSRQLLEVKRRLNPAAELAAKAHNAHVGNSITTSYEQFVEARRACNPYESLGEGQCGGLNTLFMNRSAIKLANIDAMLDFCLSSCLQRDNNFVFADICGAPGGFSEYLVRRCTASDISLVRGYGMSLVGANEHGEGTTWKLEDADFCENGTQVLYRVCNGVDGTGDIFRWGNVESMQSVIERDCRSRSSSDDAGEHGKVDVVVADGGFDAQRDAEDQEGIAQKLIVCEVAAALALLRIGGSLVLKLFGFRTDVTKCVLHYLFSSFERMVAVKPISSRPASAERYFVCTGFRGRPEGWTGPRWRDRMFLGTFRECGSSVEEKCRQRFDQYLDEFECDVLSLNLKACHMILTYLEVKWKRLDEGLDIPLGFKGPNSSIDLEAYRYIWNLI